MQFEQFKRIVGSIGLGKQLPDAVYLHRNSLEFVDIELIKFIDVTETEYGIDKDWNVLKLFKRDHRISFLHYDRFFDQSYPVLVQSYTLDLVRGKARKTSYKASENPPILHKKELLLHSDHPAVTSAKLITEEGERLGLYDSPTKIGFRNGWLKAIAERGYQLVDGHLVKRPQDVANVCNSDPVDIQRHRTAINRDSLSAPLQSLYRHGFLDGDYSLFDYGCGKGDDVAELESKGIDVSGWDPVYRPAAEKSAADIVNLGFVINVIEDREERSAVIRDAFEHASHVLSVAAMLGREFATQKYKPYKDGVVTSRNTFQKYYTQIELKEYLESCVKTKAHAVAPGVFFLFQDEETETEFLSNRQRVRRSWRTQRVRQSDSREKLAAKLLEQNKQLADSFWGTCLDLGRLPANDEFEQSDEIRKLVGSHKRAFEIAREEFDQSTFASAREARIEDLVVFQALSLFGRREACSSMPIGLRRDIKAFFGKPNDALQFSKQALFGISNTEAITAACLDAREQLDTGRLEVDHSYTVHRSMIGYLPSILRIYIGSATQLYGDIDDIDLVKIHMQSGKVTLLRYDDYSKLLPVLDQRIKIKMREQDIDWFYYGDNEQGQPLYLKSLYMKEDDPNYKKQRQFDETLTKIPEIDLSSYGPTVPELKRILSKYGLKDTANARSNNPQATA